MKEYTAEDYLEAWGKVSEEETRAAIEAYTSPYTIEECLYGCEGLESGGEILYEVVGNIDPFSVHPEYVEDLTGIDPESLFCAFGFDDDLVEELLENL